MLYAYIKHSLTREIKKRKNSHLIELQSLLLAKMGQ